MTKKGYKQTEEHIMNAINGKLKNNGFKHSKETKRKIGLANSISLIGNIPWNKGKKDIYSQETLKKMSKAKIGKKQSALHVKHRMDGNSKRWADPEYKNARLKKMFEWLKKRPTSYEKKISELCIENSLPFIYTGNGTFLINFKNPDFVNEQDKIVIEVFFSYFKIKDYGSVENYKEFCKKKYNPSGWKVIFIDENEVDVENWKELCLNKINKTMINN